VKFRVVKYLAKVTELKCHRAGVRTQDFHHFFDCHLMFKTIELDTYLQTAIMLLGREGGSEQPGRTEQCGPRTAHLCPCEHQHFLQKLY
jgi:hypothetical protein